MRTRFELLGVILLSIWTNQSFAHRLRVKTKVSPTGIHIQAQFDLGGGAPLSGRVVAYQYDQEIHRGKLDSQGESSFSFRHPAPIRIVVTDATGHRAVVQIPTRHLRAGHTQQLASALTLCASMETSALTRSMMLMWVTPPLAHVPDPPPSDPEKPSNIRNILVGVGFLLALAAFFISLRNAKEIEKLKRDAKDSEDSAES